MTVINAAKALEILEQVAKDSPDHVNKACSYQEKGAPGCIVGQAFYNLGSTGEQLRSLDLHFGAFSGNIIETGIDLLEVYAGYTVTERAYKILDRAQRSQDDGNPWGLAYESAKDWDNEHGNEYNDD